MRRGEKPRPAMVIAIVATSYMVLGERAVGIGCQSATRELLTDRFR